MAVTLPTLPQGTSTEITLKSSAVDHTPYLGGPQQRLSRLGDRFAIKVDCRPMRASQAGVVIAALLEGLAQRVLYPVPQPGLDQGQWANGSVSGSHAGGRTLSFSGGGAEKVVGQYLSIVKNGTRYLHMITAAGGSTLTVIPALRTTLSGGETIEFGEPKIEGYLVGSEQSWVLGMVENVGLTFEIVEAN
jgi:hypothetical protein